MMFTIITFFISSAQAHLLDFNDGIIIDDRGTYDQNDDMFWLQDITQFVGTYDEQVTSISEFDYQGQYNISNFHMATHSDILSAEIVVNKKIRRYGQY